MELKEVLPGVTRNDLSKQPQYNHGMVTLIRTVHAALASFYMYCLGYIYYSGFTDRITGWTAFSTAVILFEGLVVLINKGNCPLGYLHRKFGDNKSLLELLLPKRLAKQVFPLFAALSAIGLVILAI
jgi:hypothetical protein